MQIDVSLTSISDLADDLVGGTEVLFSGELEAIRERIQSEDFDCIENKIYEFINEELDKR